MAGKKGQGNGPATRARGKRAASAQDKSEQLRDKFAKITKSQAEDLKSRDLDKLTDWLGEHPRAADFIWKSVEAGAYDYLDSGDTSGTAEEEVLPAWQNKVSLLHPDNFVKPLLQELLPHLAEFFGRLKRVKKSQWADVLGFVTNVAPSSAVVTKKTHALRQYFKEQWVENGKRLSSWEPKDDATTLEDSTANEVGFNNLSWVTPRFGYFSFVIRVSHIFSFSRPLFSDPTGPLAKQWVLVLEAGRRDQRADVVPHFWCEVEAPQGRRRRFGPCQCWRSPQSSSPGRCRYSGSQIDREA